MHEVVIKYRNPRTLQLLKDFAKHFDFAIFEIPKSKKKKDFSINGVSIVAGNSEIDTSSLNQIFTGKNIDAKTLRNNAWQRKK